jgi:Tol biopolymer transport system component
MVWVVTGSLALATILLVAMLRPPMPAPRVLSYTKITNSGRVDAISDILTDGTRVYFIAHPAGNTTQRLYQASVDGKETAEIPLPFDGFFLCGISPDHTELLIATAPEAPKEHPLWVLSVLGGSPRRVGNIKAVDAVWTPDGQGIIYGSGPDVYLAKSDGSNLRRLFSAPGFASGFRWSPSGRTLRFTVMDRKTSLDSLWEASSDGSNVHPLLPNWKTPLAEAGWGQWTADGKYYVFGSIRGGKYDLWAIREKRDLLHKYSREPVQLSAGPTQLTRPILSPDGRHLFVISAETRGDLLRFDAKSSEFSPLLVGLSAHRLTFTGDGQWVAYTTYPDSELWRSKADGSDKLRLSFSPIRADLPRWSPDGKQIVFMAGEGAKPGDIYVIPRDGGEPKRLLPEGMNGADPDWSPDGMSIVFGPQPTFPQTPSASGGTAAPAGSIRVVDLNTRKISELPDSAGLYRPRWSTKGNYIAALSVDTHRLMLLDLATHKWTLLATGKTLHNPLWSRNGTTIYFQDLGGPDQPIYRVNATGQKVERIADSEMIRRTDMIYSAFTGLTPEDSPIVLTIQTINDIYGLELSLP